MLSIAGELVKSGLLPTHIKTPQAAVAIILKGSELGVPAMYALSNIVVIGGKPTANAELMLSLIYRDQGDDAVQVVETTKERCTVSYKRRSWRERQSYTFSMEDARTAGLVKAGPWTSYPAAMLRARCISAVARMAFPDSIGGLYTAEELGAAVTVHEGEVVLDPELDDEPLIVEDNPAIGKPVDEATVHENLDSMIKDLADHLGKGQIATMTDLSKLGVSYGLRPLTRQAGPSIEWKKQLLTKLNADEKARPMPEQEFGLIDQYLQELNAATSLAQLNEIKEQYTQHHASGQLTDEDLRTLTFAYDTSPYAPAEEAVVS